MRTFRWLLSLALVVTFTGPIASARAATLRTVYWVDASTVLPMLQPDYPPDPPPPPPEPVPDPPPPPPVYVQSAPQPASTAGVGECTGFVIPDYIIQRESRGNLDAQNPSGAFGCAQIMPFWWSTPNTPNQPGCADLDRYSLVGQQECVNRISHGGTDLRAWGG